MIIIDANSLNSLSMSDIVDRIEPIQLASPGVCVGTIDDEEKRKALESMNVQFIDDATEVQVMALAKKHASQASKVSIVSSNPAYLCVLGLSDSIYVDNPEEMVVYSQENAESKLGLSANQIVDLFFVTGLKALNIPQWAPISPSDAKSWIQVSGDFHSLVLSPNSPAQKHPLAAMMMAKGASARKNIDAFKKTLSEEPSHTIDLARCVTIPEGQNAEEEIENGRLQTLSQITRFLKLNPDAPIAIALEGHKSNTAFQFAENLQIIELHIEGQETAYIHLGDFSRQDQRLKKVLTNALSSRSGPKCTDEAKALYCFLGEAAFNADKLYLNDVGLIAHTLDNRVSQPSLEKLLSLEGMVTSGYRAADVRKVYDILREKVSAPANAIVKEQLMRTEIPLNKILANMEFHGVKIDLGVLQRNERKLRGEAAKIKKSIDKMVGRSVDISNVEDLKRLLFTELKLKAKTLTPKKEPSVGADALEEIKDQHEVVGKILDYKDIFGLITSGFEPIKNNMDRKSRKIHASFNQDLTKTGRLSCSDPNLQAIPVRSDLARRIREAFVEDISWTFIKADYSQAEIFVLAHLSGCSKLQNTLMSGEDIHRATAAEVLNKNIKDVTDADRAMAKAINFGLIYGMTEYGLAKKLGTTPKVAAGYVAQYFKKYPVVEGYLECLKEHARNDNYVTTGMGRKIYLKHDGEKISDGGLMNRAVNAPMQGTVADIVKKAMVKVASEIANHPSKPEARISMQVHDEIIVSCANKDVDIVREIVETSMNEKMLKFMPHVDVSVYKTLEKVEEMSPEAAIA